MPHDPRDQRQACFAAPADPLALLQAAAVPMLQVDATGQVIWANAAAVQKLDAQPGSSAAALWQDMDLPEEVGIQAEDEPGPQRRAALDGQSYRITVAPLSDGTSLWTMQSTQTLSKVRAELGHQLELMGLAREFGRVGVWERDVRTLQGRWDREMLRFWGLDPNQGSPDFAQATRNIFEEDRVAIGNIFTASIKQAGHYSTRYRVRGYDGQVRRIHSQWLVKNGSDGQPERVLGLMMDDTETCALAQAAQELGSQLALAVEVSGLAIWRHDMDAGRTHYSDQGWAALGMTPRPEGLTLAEVRTLIHPDDLPAVMASAVAAMDSPHPVNVEARYRHADGSWRHQMLRRTVLRDAQGRPTAFLGVAMDITDQRVSEQALQTAEERIGLAVRGVGLGTWELDLETGSALWDEQMWRLRGRDPQNRAMTAAERMACVHPADRAWLQEALAQDRAIEGTLERQFRVQWPDGQVRWLASRSRALVDSHGRPRRIGVNWDITDSRITATALHEREVALRDNEAKSRFLARMSHELRTPLNAVLGFTALLQAAESAESAESAADAAGTLHRQRLAHIAAAGKHLLALISDVLHLSALAGGGVRITLEPVALRPLLDGAMALLGPDPQPPGRPPVPVRAGTLDEVVVGDATRLRQVLLNLLSNAIKYNRPGGEVRVDAQRQGDRVLLRVADDGRGLDETQRSQLFEPFNRLGADLEAIEGTGIGLAIVKALVERMDGSIAVHSQLGVGTVVEVSLRAGPVAVSEPTLKSEPSRVPQSPVAATASASASASTGAQRRLLYIEDNPVNALIIMELLAPRTDLHLHVAVDGTSGLAQALALQPELILLDMQLPDFDGYEVMRRLRADPRTAGIRCVALSANVMPQDIERALQAGVSDYWTKPLDFTAFTAAIDALFGPAL